MNAEQTKSQIRRYIDEVWNKGNMEAGASRISSE
jgi:hypothetical protein